MRMARRGLGARACRATRLAAVCCGHPSGQPRAGRRASLLTRCVPKAHGLARAQPCGLLVVGASPPTASTGPNDAVHRRTEGPYRRRGPGHSPCAGGAGPRHSRRARARSGGGVQRVPHLYAGRRMAACRLEAAGPRRPHLRARGRARQPCGGVAGAGRHSVHGRGQPQPAGGGQALVRAHGVVVPGGHCAAPG